jgi:cytochrome P450
MNAVMPRLEDFEDKSFDVLAANRAQSGCTLDPYPTIHQKHAEKTVHAGSYWRLFEAVPDVFERAGFAQFMVFGYDNVVSILLDQENFGSHEVFKHFLGPTFGRSVTAMDPPEHTRFRKIFQKAFLPHVVAGWGQAFVDPVVDRLLMGFARRGEAELIQEFTHLYPFQVIYSQLGLDEGQGPIFHKLAEAQLLNMIGLPQGEEAAKKLGVFFEALVAIRRADPGGDLVSHLATVEADGERLPDDVLIGFLRQLMNAGGDTTYRSTSNLLVGLLRNPEQLEAVRRDRSLIPRAIEEALRWEVPILRGWRYVKNDVVIDGHPVPRGAVVNTIRGSANRDPAKFEDPDRFDIFREHLARPIPFSTGAHVCIGQHLARLEMTRALNALLDRLPNLRLDPAYPPPQPIGHDGRVPERIHVRFDPV